MLLLFNPFGNGGAELVEAGGRRPDGWYSPGDNCWDLWVSNELAATITRSAVRWSGVHYGGPGPRKEFSGPRDSPRTIMAQIEEYATDPICRERSVCQTN